MRTTAHVRKIKREYMRRARLDPIKRNRWNDLRRGKYIERHKAYMAKKKADHFFRWRADNWRHGKVTAKELASLWRKQRGRCALSGRKLRRDAHLDHIVAKSQGGIGKINNLRWLDPQINMMRHNFSDEEFARVCSQIAEWIGRRIVEAIAHGDSKS